MTNAIPTESKPTTIKGIEAWPLGAGLLLVCDENNPDGGPGAWAVVEEDLPETRDYEAWWGLVEVVPTDDRILGALARAVAGRDVRF